MNIKFILAIMFLVPGNFYGTKINSFLDEFLPSTREELGGAAKALAGVALSSAGIYMGQKVYNYVKNFSPESFATLSLSFIVNAHKNYEFIREHTGSHEYYTFRKKHL